MGILQEGSMSFLFRVIICLTNKNEFDFSKKLCYTIIAR